MPETLVREYKPKPEDFLKKKKRIFWRGERGIAEARSVLAPPARARTSPFAESGTISEAPRFRARCSECLQIYAPLQFLDIVLPYTLIV